MYQNYFNSPQPTAMNGLSPTIFNSTIRQEIVKVNGENGARAYQLAPNCSALLLDESNPIVWLVQTDGAGYKTVSPYSITPYQPAPPVDLNAIEARLKKVEEKLNGKPDFISNERPADNSDMATGKKYK